MDYTVSIESAKDYTQYVIDNYTAYSDDSKLKEGDIVLLQKSRKNTLIGYTPNRTVVFPIREEGLTYGYAVVGNYHKYKQSPTDNGETSKGYYAASLKNLYDVDLHRNITYEQLLEYLANYNYEVRTDIVTGNKSVIISNGHMVAKEYCIVSVLAYSSYNNIYIHATFSVKKSQSDNKTLTIGNSICNTVVSDLNAYFVCNDDCCVSLGKIDILKLAMNKIKFPLQEVLKVSLKHKKSFTSSKTYSQYFDSGVEELYTSLCVQH